jgi:hypothetical protein
VQDLTPPDHRARVVICQCILANAFWTHSLWATSCLLTRWDSQGTVLWNFIIPISGWMIIPTPPWCQNTNVYFLSMSVWAYCMVNC